MKYTIIIEKGRESGYIAYAPALKGCVSQGKTKEEALANIKEAAELCLESMEDEGWTIPDEYFLDNIEVAVS